MNKVLLIATTNKGKIVEINQILKNTPFVLKSLAEVGFNQEIEETGKTFAENARIKATTAGKKTGLLTLAEDSGIEIDALEGAPGIYSARYAPGSDSDRVNKVLKDLIDIPKEKRTARFVCVAALFDPEKNTVRFFEGESWGMITEKPIGVNGFGYDPIFYNPDLEKTNGEASLEEKNKVSHRARALLKVKKFLSTSGTVL